MHNFFNRAISITQAELNRNPERYLVLDGRQIEDESVIPAIWKPIIKKFNKSCSPEKISLPIFTPTNENCRLISSKPKVDEKGNVYTPAYIVDNSYKPTDAIGSVYADPRRQFVSTDENLSIGFILNQTKRPVKFRSVTIAPKVPYDKELYFTANCFKDDALASEIADKLNPVIMPEEISFYYTNDTIDTYDEEAVKNVRWTKFENNCVIPLSEWSLATGKKINITDDESEGYTGFKIEVSKWNRSIAHPSETDYGLSYFNIEFDESHLDGKFYLPKMLSYDTDFPYKVIDISDNGSSKTSSTNFVFIGANKNNTGQCCITHGGQCNIYGEDCNEIIVNLCNNKDMQNDPVEIHRLILNKNTRVIIRNDDNYDFVFPEKNVSGKSILLEKFGERVTCVLSDNKWTCTDNEASFQSLELTAMDTRRM